MTGGYLDLYIDRGTVFNYTIYLSDDQTNEPLNVANYIITSKMKRSYYSENVSANLVCTIGDAANGEVTLSLSHTVTANLVPGRYVFDVLSDGGSGPDKIISGTIHVDPTVSL